MSEHPEKLFRLAYQFYLAPDDFRYKVDHYRIDDDEFLTLLELLDEDSSGNSAALSRHAASLATDAATLGKAARKFLEHYLLIETHTHYQTLGVASTASAGQIRRNYRHLIGLFHPDKSNVNSDRYALRINQAYNVLKKPSSRKKYDKSRRDTAVADSARHRPAANKKSGHSRKPGKLGLVSGLLDMLPGFRRYPKAWVWSTILAIAMLVIYTPAPENQIEPARQYVGEEVAGRSFPAPALPVDLVEDGLTRQQRDPRYDAVIDGLEQDITGLSPLSAGAGGPPRVAVNKDTNVPASEITAPEDTSVPASETTAPAAEVVLTKPLRIPADLIMADVGSNPVRNGMLLEAGNDASGFAVGSRWQDTADKRSFRLAQSAAKPFAGAAKQGKIASQLEPAEVFPVTGNLEIGATRPDEITDQHFYDIVSPDEGEAAVFDAGTPPEMLLMRYVSAYESGDAGEIASLFSSESEANAAAKLEQDYNQIFAQTKDRKITINELIIKPESNSEALMLSDLALSLQHKRDDSYKQYTGKMIFRVTGNKNGISITGLQHNVR